MSAHQSVPKTAGQEAEEERVEHEMSVIEQEPPPVHGVVKLLAYIYLVYCVLFFILRSLGSTMKETASASCLEIVMLGMMYGAYRIAIRGRVAPKQLGQGAAISYFVCGAVPFRIATWVVQTGLFWFFGGVFFVACLMTKPIWAENIVFSIFALPFEVLSSARENIPPVLFLAKIGHSLANIPLVVVLSGLFVFALGVNAFAVQVCQLWILQTFPLSRERACARSVAASSMLISLGWMFAFYSNSKLERWYECFLLVVQFVVHARLHVATSELMAYHAFAKARNTGSTNRQRILLVPVLAHGLSNFARWLVPVLDARSSLRIPAEVILKRQSLAPGFLLPSRSILRLQLLPLLVNLVLAVIVSRIAFRAYSDVHRKL